MLDQSDLTLICVTTSSNIVDVSCPIITFEAKFKSRCSSQIYIFNL